MNARLKNINLNVNPNESKIFLDYNKDKGDNNTPNVQEKFFSRAVTAWMSENKVKSLKEYAAQGNDLRPLYQFRGGIVSEYLCRRTVECKPIPFPEFKMICYVPKLSFYEKQLYQGLSVFDNDIMHRGKHISFRCGKMDKSILEILNISEEKIEKKLKNNPIYNFPFSGMNELECGNILEINSKSFNKLKTQNPIKYNGLHYMSFTSLVYYEIAKKDLPFIQDGKIVGSEEYFLEGLRDLEKGYIVPFDNCPFNIILQQVNCHGHAFVCLHIINTQKKKFEKILIFDSQINSTETSKDFKDAVEEKYNTKDLFEIIYYCTQRANDQSCSLYALHTINALTNLLTDEKSVLNQLFAKPEFTTQLYSNIRLELQKALPEYFHEKDGKMELNDFQEILQLHVKDKWLIGSIAVKGFKKGKIKNFQTYKVLEAIKTKNLQQEAVAQILASSKLVDEQIFSKQIFFKLLCLIILLISVYFGFSNFQK